MQLLLEETLYEQKQKETGHTVCSSLLASCLHEVGWVLSKAQLHMRL